MGIERDYLVRQIMMLIEFIRRIAGFREKAQNDAARREIKNFYKLLNLEESVLNKNIRELTDYLINERKLTNDHLEIIAFVMKEQGEMITNKQVQEDLFRKAYLLLAKVDRESITFSMERKIKMGELKEYLI